MTAATRSLRFIRHWRRSVHSPHRPVPPNFLFLSVGRAALTPPPATHRTPGKACGPCPAKRPVGRDPCVPPPITAAFPATCHCEPVTDVTGVSIRSPTLCLLSRALSSYRITSISNPPCSARYVWGAGRIRFHRPTPCRPFSAARRNLA